MNNTKTFKRIGRVAALAVMVCLLVCMPLPLTAFAENTKVTESAKGTLQVNLTYRDDNNSNIIFATGTGFLINSDTLVTCAHVVNLTDDECEYFANYFEKSIAEFKSRLGYSVTVQRDVRVTATIEQMSLEMDFAILQLGQSIQNVTPLAIRSSSSVQRTETVYAIGFPEESGVVQSVSTFTSDDATITQGIINKIDSGTYFTGASVDYLQTSCKLTSGNSGGPMVDEDGNVVGICQGSTGTYESGDDYFYAIAIDQVTAVCDALGIPWTPAGSSPATTPDTEPTESTEAPEPTEPVVSVNTAALEAAIDEARAIPEDGYTEDSYANLTAALNAAESAKLSSDQVAIDRASEELRAAIDGLEDQKSNTTLLIIIIAAAVVVAVVVVVVLVVVSGSKKKKAAPAAAAAGRREMAGAGSMNKPAASQSGAFVRNDPTPMAGRPNGTMPLTPEVGETTILNQGAGETTVLSKVVNGGALIRLKTRERLTINKESMTIGRERKRVDICIPDNTSISRLHAKLVVRNGVTYLIDQNAANGTFVNGVKATPNQEVALKDGDKVMLAAEEFEYHA